MARLAAVEDVTVDELVTEAGPQEVDSFAAGHFDGGRGFDLEADDPTVFRSSLTTNDSKGGPRLGSPGRAVPKGLHRNRLRCNPS